jgi:hypothetical protein
VPTSCRHGVVEKSLATPPTPPLPPRKPRERRAVASPPLTQGGDTEGAGGDSAQGPHHYRASRDWQGAVPPSLAPPPPPVKAKGGPPGGCHTSSFLSHSQPRSLRPGAEGAARQDLPFGRLAAPHATRGRFSYWRVTDASWNRQKNDREGAAPQQRHWRE